MDVKTLPVSTTCPRGGLREDDRADQVLRQAAFHRSGESLGVGAEEPKDRGLGLRRPGGSSNATSNATPVRER